MAPVLSSGTLLYTRKHGNGEDVYVTAGGSDSKWVEEMAIRLSVGLRILLYSSPMKEGLICGMSSLQSHHKRLFWPKVFVYLCVPHRPFHPISSGSYMVWRTPSQARGLASWMAVRSFS